MGRAGWGWRSVAEGPWSLPLILKSYFARNVFLEICFCVILQGIQNCFVPCTPRISLGALKCLSFFFRRVRLFCFEPPPNYAGFGLLLSYSSSPLSEGRYIFNESFDCVMNTVSNFYFLLNLVMLTHVCRMISVNYYSYY